MIQAKKRKVNLTLYRLGHAVIVSGVRGSIISIKSAHESGNVVNLSTGRLYSQEIT
jgi:hypothetical protein